MRKVVLVLLVATLALGVFATPALAATEAQIDVIQLVNSSGSWTVTFISGTVSCDSPLTYVGRVNARNETTGETITIERVRGTCTGSPEVWDVGQTQILGSVPCGTDLIFGGQLRLSNGAKLFVGKERLTIPCF
jgi:hypothetical protein